MHSLFTVSGKSRLNTRQNQGLKFINIWKKNEETENRVINGRKKKSADSRDVTIHDFELEYFCFSAQKKRRERSGSSLKTADLWILTRGSKLEDYSGHFFILHMRFLFNPACLDKPILFCFFQIRLQLHWWRGKQCISFWPRLSKVSWLNKLRFCYSYIIIDYIIVSVLTSFL